MQNKRYRPTHEWLLSTIEPKEHIFTLSEFAPEVCKLHLELLTYVKETVCIEQCKQEINLGNPPQPYPAPTQYYEAEDAFFAKHPVHNLQLCREARAVRPWVLDRWKMNNISPFLTEMQHVHNWNTGNPNTVGVGDRFKQWANIGLLRTCDQGAVEAYMDNSKVTDMLDEYDCWIEEAQDQVNELLARIQRMKNRRSSLEDARDDFSLQ